MMMRASLPVTDYGERAFDARPEMSGSTFDGPKTVGSVP